MRLAVLALRDGGAPAAARVEVLSWATAAVPASALVCPDQWVFLDALVAGGHVEEALQASQLLPRRLACHNRVLYRLCAARRLADALLVHERMCAVGPAPSLASYRTLLGACGASPGDRATVERLLAALRSQGLALDGLTANCALHALRCEPRAQLGLRAQLRAAGLPLDVVGLNTLLRGLASHDAGPPAARAAACGALLREAAAGGVALDSGSLAAGVAALGAAGRAPDALALWTELRGGGVVPCERGWGALLAALAQAGDVATCQRLFDALPFPPQAHHWNALASAAARAGQHERALGVASAMAARGCPPDDVTRRTLLRATAQLRGLPTALDAALALVADGRGGARALGAVLDMAAEAGDAPIARSAMLHLRAQGRQPDAGAWGACVRAHARAGDAPGGCAVLEAQLACALFRPTAAQVLPLLRACCERGDGASLERARAAMGAARARLAPADARDLAAAWAAAAHGAQLPTWLAEAVAEGALRRGRDGGAAGVSLHACADRLAARAQLLCALRTLRDAHAAAPRRRMGAVRVEAHGEPLEAARHLLAELQLPAQDHHLGLLITASDLAAWLART